MSGFTPGPWVWYNNLSGEKIGISVKGGQDVLYVNHSESIVIPREKDAHLIAAAPDLYEALSSVMNEIGSCLADETYYFGNTKLFDLARSALSKARGES